MTIKVDDVTKVTTDELIDVNDLLDYIVGDTDQNPLDKQQPKQ